MPPKYLPKKPHTVGGRATCVLGVEHLKGVHHGTSKYVGVLLAAKVEAVDLPGVTPLVEGLRGLVVLQPLGNGTVYHHLETFMRRKEETFFRLLRVKEMHF